MPAETVIVTGSSGYLGYAAATRLGGMFDVMGFDRRMPAHPPPSAECLYTDVTSEPSLRQALEAVRNLHGPRVASVLHFAAYYDFSGAPSPLYEKVTVQGTARLLRLIREVGLQAGQFIFASTMLVHAPTTPGHPIREDWPLRPTWPYPASKVRTEEVIRRERGEIPVVILRMAGVYDDLGHTVPLPRQIQRIYERDPTAYMYPGNLAHGQAFMHLEDLLDLYVRLVQRRAELPHELVLGVGEPETVGYGELQTLLGRLIHGEEWKTWRVPVPLAKVGAWLLDRLPLGTRSFVKPWMVERAADHYELDITRARTTVGWNPQRRLRETLPKIVAALRADPWAWYRENELEMPAWLADTMPRAEEEEITPRQWDEMRKMIPGQARRHTHTPAP